MSESERILEILIRDGDRKITYQAFFYPTYNAASKDFDALCAVFSRMIEYRKRENALRKQASRDIVDRFIKAGQNHE